MVKKRLYQVRRNKVTLQLQDIFKLLEIEHTLEAERLAQTLLNFLVYMAPQDELKTPWSTFIKLSSDLICITEVSKELLTSQAADTLDVKSIITLPS